MDNELGNLVKHLSVDRAEADLQGFRGRALNVLGVAGGLLTIVSGFFAIATNTAHKVQITSTEGWILAASLALYVFSAITALLVNIPRNVDMPDAEKLKEFVDNDWEAEGWEKEVTAVSVTYLASVKSVNKINARYLAFAIGLEIGGMALTAIVTVLVVGHVV